MNGPQRAGAERPDDATKEAKPAWAPDQHSGEGSASALQSLRKQEDNRKEPERPPDTEAAAPEPSP